MPLHLRMDGVALGKAQRGSTLHGVMSGSRCDGHLHEAITEGTRTRSGCVCQILLDV